MIVLMYKKFLSHFAYYNFVFVLIGLSIALALWGLGQLGPATVVVIVISVLAIIPSARDMIKTLISGQVGIDVIALAAIGSSLLLRQYVAAGVIVIMLTGGEALEEFAKNRAKRELNALLKRKPTIAHRIVGDNVEEVPVARIKVGDPLLVKPGDTIPVDGKIYKGVTSVDESAITG